MRKYNIVVAKPDRNDSAKHYWKNCGSLLYFEPTTEKPEAGFILELNMFPTTDFKVFAADTKKPEQSRDLSTTEEESKQSDRIEYPTESIEPDDIPF